MNPSITQVYPLNSIYATFPNACDCLPTNVPNSDIKSKNALGRLLLENVATSTAHIKEFLQEYRQRGSNG